MKRKIYIIIILALLLASTSAACQKPDGKTSTAQITPSITIQPTSVKTSEAPITFIFLESEKHLYESLYHQLAYLHMESQGYSISNLYVDETQDINGLFNQLESNGNKYVIITSDLLTQQVIDYQQSNAASMTFIQYSEEYTDTIFSYQIKLYEYYYLAGIALCNQSASHIAGFVAENPDEQTIRCINAFALGMKSVNEDSVVIVNWIENTADETGIAQTIENLVYQKCDVFAYFMSGDLAEKVSSNQGAYYMTMSTHIPLSTDEKLAIKPMINLDTYYSDIINSGKEPASYEFKYLGIQNQVVSYELSSSISDDAKSAVESAYNSIANGYQIFSGPIYNDVGLIVPEGMTLPDADVLDMLWFVDNVVGDLPAG